MAGGALSPLPELQLAAVVFRPLRDNGENLPQLGIMDWSAPAATTRTVSLPANPYAIEFAPNGKTLIVACGDGTICCVDAHDGQKQAEIQTQPWKFWAPRFIRFTPDGRMAAIPAGGDSIEIREAENLNLRYPAFEHKERGIDCTFSADGRYLATASFDSTVMVWDIATGTAAIAAPLRHPGWVYNARFSSDGRLLVTAGRDVRVWDWRQGELVCPAMEHSDEVFDAAFLTDKSIVTASRDSSASNLGDCNWQTVGKAQPLSGPGWANIPVRGPTKASDRGR